MNLKKLISVFAAALILLSLLTVPAFADMGPKSQLIVRVKNAPDELYYLDLLVERPLEQSGSSSRWENEDTELDPALVKKMELAVPDGWRACTLQGTGGAPIWGDLLGEDGTHRFGYHGVPWTYRVLMVTASGEVFLSESCTRTLLQSSATVDWADKSLFVPPVWVGYVLELLSTLVPTLLMEGLLLLVMRLRSKRNLLIFLLCNTVTQLVLFFVLGTTALEQGVSITYYLLFFPVELIILLTESIAYRRFFTGCTKKRATLYGILANLSSAALGFFLAEPVWRFIVSIS